MSERSSGPNSRLGLPLSTWYRSTGTPALAALSSERVRQTTRNIVANGQLFGVAILCNLVTLILDVVIAWPLYVLLVPVNRSLSLLTAWFRLVCTAVAFVAVLHLVTVYRLLTTLIWPRFHGLLTVCMAVVPYGQVKDFEAVHGGVPAADGGAA